MFRKDDHEEEVNRTYEIRVVSAVSSTEGSVDSIQPVVERGTYCVDKVQ